MTWSGEAETDPAIFGSATLAMVVSSAVMMVASMIEIVIMPRLAVFAGATSAMFAKVFRRYAANFPWLVHSTAGGAMQGI